VKPQLVCEIQFTEWTKDGQMRHPVFLGLREDKPAKDVGFEVEETANKASKQAEDNLKVPTQSETTSPASKKTKKGTVKNPKKKKAITTEKASDGESMIKKNRKGGIDKKIKVNGNTLQLTNLNKVFWPEEGYTKGDLIEYYQKIAKYILPYLKDRPESMNRHPNGIDGENFFQKNINYVLPEWVKTFEVPSGSKGSINYLVCQNKATLMYMANLGCIEINPWSSRINSLDYPDYLIIDLDPLNVDFEVVIEAALMVKEVLDQAKIPGFPKTSGSKGMHILVPLGAKYTYEECKQFAHIIVKAVQKRLPKTTSLERSPKKRPNKLYLDYLQNNHGQTIAVAYCVRPRKGATISTPLEWSEVKKGLHPSQFTMKNIFERLEQKGDLMKGLLKHKGIDMEKALESLAGLI
ncbi:MAG: DNA ligase, partial [Bacteroidetes bacterium]|nr:DNA ligase [Bacteroidota bacterium]